MKWLGALLAFALVVGSVPLAAAQGTLPAADRTVLLQLDRSGTIRAHMEKTLDDVRSALRNSRIAYEGLKADLEAVQVRIADTDDIERATEQLAPLTRPLSAETPLQLLTLSEPEPGLLVLARDDEAFDQHFSALTAKAVAILKWRVRGYFAKGIAERPERSLLGESSIVVEGWDDDRILVRVRGVEDVARIERLLSTTARLTFRFVDQSMPVEEAIEGRPPAGSRVLYSSEDPPRPFLVENLVVVSGDSLLDAKAMFDRRNDEPIVVFRLDNEGTARLGQVTQGNVGRILAIVMDEQVMVAPEISEPIPGGTVQISGSFSVEYANDLATLLQAGPLPADFVILRSQ